MTSVTEALIERLQWRFLYVVGRNFLVWRKLMYASMVGNMADPMIYLVGLGFGLGAFMPPIAGMPYINFLAGGMLCYSAMNSATFEALYSAFSRLKVQRTWEGILHAPMTAADVVIGEWVWAALKSTLSGVAMLLAMYLLGIVHGLRPLAVMPVVLLIGLAFSGLGLIMTALARTYEFFVFYFTLVVTPMMFVSGVFYPRSALPGPVQLAASFLPLAHGADLARALTLGVPMAHPLLSVGVLLAYATMGVLLAIRLIKRRLLN
jgi:lipooligosaccharide transport system permease protein